jgi:uncharacterized protein involved in type VI secretion and phage assembly
LIDLGTLPALMLGTDGNPRVSGVAVGIVTNNRDPEGHGRIKVRLPWLHDQNESFWARLVTPMAGKDRGLLLIPEVDDEVLVAFEHGAPEFAFIIGSLWNGRDRPPQPNAGNDHRLLKSRSGHVIRLVDSAGEERIEIIDAGGQNRIVIDTHNNSVAIEAGMDVTIRAAGALQLQGRSIEIRSDAGLTIDAGSGVDVKAAAALTLKGATVDIN